MVNFKILHKDGKARVGRLTTPHGVIETPNFNPVGTQATVKALGSRELKEIGVQIVLANTYHNVYFITNLVKNIREAIANGEFKRLKQQVRL